MNALSVLFYLVTVSCLFAPGFVASRLFVGSQATRALLSISLSYAIYTIFFVVSNYINIDSLLFNSIYGAMVAACVLACLFSLGSLAKVDRSLLFDIAVMIGVVALYHFIVGAYDQIPADVYTHLTRYQFAKGSQIEGTLGPALSLASLFSQKGGVWYHFVATVNSWFGLSAQNVHYVITLITKTVLLLSVYLFGRVAFRGGSYERILALLSTLFFAVYLGVNVFSYLRYYSFAPTMLAYVLFMAAVGLFVESTLLQGEDKPVSYYRLGFAGVIVSFLFLAMMAVHMQEALFLVLMVTGISFSVVINRLFGLKTHLGVIHYLVLFLALLCFLVAYSYAKTHMERAPNIGWRLWDFGNIGLGLPQVTILNLRFQFIEVVTYWGCFVYIVLLFKLKQFRNNVALLGGMLIPVFTVLNPFFVDLFLRVYKSTLLYRILYAVPIHYIAALIVVHAFTQLRNLFNRKSSFLWAGVLVLIFSLLALPTKPEYRQYSRWQTLKSVARDQGMSRFADLVEFLDREPKVEVLTDPVVGYYIAGSTHHRYLRKSFLWNHTRFAFSDYSSYPLSQHKGKLLLINDRRATDSKTGKLSGHWPESILDVRRYYPSSLREHVKSNPAKFPLIWESEQEDIQLYKIE